MSFPQYHQSLTAHLKEVIAKHQSFEAQFDSIVEALSVHQFHHSVFAVLSRMLALFEQWFTQRNTKMLQALHRFEKMGDYGQERNVGIEVFKADLTALTELITAYEELVQM